MSVVVAILTAIGLVLPMSLFQESSSTVGSDPVTITDYHATYDVDAAGTMTAVERVTAEFPADRHGIFRFWDVTDSADPRVRYLPENIDVTMDGQDVPVELSWRSGKRFRVAKIGDAGSYVSVGSHVYEIRYTVDGVLASGYSKPNGDDASSSWGGRDTSRFVWRVVADGWQMPIEKSTSTVTLPAEPVNVSCTTGDGTACRIDAPSPTTRVVTTGALGPNTGVALRADLAIAAPERTSVPWPPALDPVLGRSWLLALFLGLLSLVTFGIGVSWVLRSRESIPLLPVMYEPPADPQDPARVLSPVQTYFVAHEKMPARALTATLMHMAERGLIRLRHTDDTWTITSTRDGSAWARADPVSTGVADALGIRHPGTTFLADGSVDAGKTLESAQSAISSATKRWSTGSGAITRSGFEIAGRIVVGIAVLLAGFLFIVEVMPFSLLVLPIAAFVIGGIGLWTSGVGTRRTLLGRDIWSRAGGFERLLSTPSNKDRLDFGARKDLYTSYIPYAVAFNCADAWAEKYRMATNAEPPTPTWVSDSGSSSGSHGLFGGAGGIDSFESSISSSISAYTASQSSSSSSGGGGGFSGGGGGGGGGGGSW